MHNALWAKEDGIHQRNMHVCVCILDMEIAGWIWSLSVHDIRIHLKCNTHVTLYRMVCCIFYLLGIPKFWFLPTLFNSNSQFWFVLASNFFGTFNLILDLSFYYNNFIFDIMMSKAWTLHKNSMCCHNCKFLYLTFFLQNHQSWYCIIYLKFIIRM